MGLDIDEIFSNYVKQFYSTDPVIQRNILLKEKHSFIVKSNMEKLAKGLGLYGEEKFMANIIGLFHDVGRFQQFKTYKTFDDTLSVNHAELSVNILKSNRLLGFLNYKKRSIILRAILLHNVKDLPSKGLSNIQFLFCRMIRDADKLDIWRILAENYESPENDDYITLNYKNENKCSKEIINHVIKGNTIAYNQIETILELKLLHMSWVFNLHFNYSFKLLQESGVIERITALLPENEEIQQIKQLVLSFIDKKVNELSYDYVSTPKKH